MEFSILGRLRVAGDDGAGVRISQPRQRGLLTVLLLHANQPMTVSRLTESLWDRDDSAVGPGALRTQIWALRKVLAPATRLHTAENGDYVLEVRPGELDVAQFRQLAAQGRAASESEDLSRAARFLSEALAMWREPPLTDVPATLAMARVTHRLLEERRVAQELLTDARLGLGQHASLIPDLRESTAADPASERLWEQLMLALHGAGRTAEALAAYQQARTSMQAELGLEPGSRLQQLHRRILAGDRRPGRPAAPGASGPRPSAGRTLAKNASVTPQREADDAGHCRATGPGHTHVIFSVLNGLAIRHGDVWLPLPPPKPRAVLATLLLRANAVVSAGTLAESLWGAQPPATAAVALQNHVLRLRRQLGACVGARIKTVSPGYLVNVCDDELDLHQFTRLRDSGRAAGQRGAWVQAESDLRQAVELFGGGSVFAGVEALGIHLPDMPDLAEMGLQTLEWLIDADLYLGRYAEAVAELRRITALHPLRERFREQLMIALTRSGRQAEALSAYRDARQVILDELRVEPGQALRELYRQIVAADPALYDRAELPWWAVADAQRPARFSGVPPAAQVPVDLADFTGRTALSVDLAAWITETGDHHPGQVRIAAVTGPGGAGKTALAIHVAHQVRDRFPGGQLYADLGGGEPSPADAGDVLARFLRDLGDTSHGAAGGSGADEERQAAYRSLLAGRRMLIVLDNARDPAQIRPLLPGTAECAVLITSRGRMADLDGARVIELGMLDEADALAMLRRIIGPARADADPRAADDVLHACAGLPLAIRIAASRLASRPAWSIRSFANRLADQRSRLDELRSGDRAVRGSFAISYHGLPRPAGCHEVSAARAFRVLGTWPGPSLSLDAAAAMLGCTPPTARASIEELVDAHLIESVGPAGYRFHDLLRAYANERAGAEERPETLRAARAALATWYLHSVIAAIHAVSSRRSNLPTVPGLSSCRPLAFADAAAALDWLDSERENLVLATTVAAGSCPDATAWQLPVFLAVYFELRSYFADWISTHEMGLAAARRAGDRAGRAWLGSSLGAALVLLERPAEAVRHLRPAAALHREAGEDRGHGNTLNTLGVAYAQLGDTGRSVRCLEQALAIRRRTDDLHGQAMTLGNLAMANREAAQFATALDHADPPTLTGN